MKFYLVSYKITYKLVNAKRSKTDISFTCLSGPSENKGWTEKDILLLTEFATEEYCQKMKIKSENLSEIDCALLGISLLNDCDPDEFFDKTPDKALS